MNKNNYTNEYYLKKISKINDKIEPHLNDALIGVYGEFLSLNTKSEFPVFFLILSLLSIAQVDYYLHQRNECYSRMEKEEGMTQPIKLRKIVEYKKR